MKFGYSSFTLILIALVAIVAALPAFAQDAEKGFVGNTQCKICHNKPAEGEQWNKWKAEKHAEAYKLLLTDKAKEVGAAKGLKTPPAESPECLRCHVTGYDVEKKAPPSAIKLEDGMQCESCHGPASLHLVDGKKLKTAKDKSGIDVFKNIVKPDESVCRKCHNEDNPTYNPERYTLEDGKKADFDFKQAFEKIKHPNPLKPADAAAPK